MDRISVFLQVPTLSDSNNISKYAMFLAKSLASINKCGQSFVKFQIKCLSNYSDLSNYNFATIKKIKSQLKLTES